MNCRFPMPTSLQLPLSSTISCTQSVLLGFRFRLSLDLQLPAKNNLRKVLFCSISKVDNYGTVDFERKPSLKWSRLYRKISLMANPNLGSSSILEQWERDGKKKLSKWELRRIIKQLRKYRRYKLALEVYDWMVSQGERFELSSSDVAIQLDLIAKVDGILSAEDCFSKLPESSLNERTYGALLNAYVQTKMKEKAEAIMDKMRKGSFLTHALPFNEMMTLYMNTNEHEKVSSVIQEMREKKIPLDLFSYNIWVSTCGAIGDIKKMEQVIEQMAQDQNVNANWTTYSTLATMYIKLGHVEKGEICLKELELRITGRDRTPYNYLITLYGKIGKKEEVNRIWELYKVSFNGIPNLGYHSMISSLVRLGDTEGAEQIYKEWESVRTSYDPRITNILLGWYVREGLLKKAEDFIEHLREIGGRPNPNTWEILAEGYLREREISKALSAMREAMSIERGRGWRLRPANVASMLELCEQEADVASAEGFVEVLRDAGCLNKDAYKRLIRTCIKAGRSVDELELCMERDGIDGDEETKMLLNQLSGSL